MGKRAGDERKVNYKIVYKDKGIPNSRLIHFRIVLPNIRSLAKQLNNFIKRNPEYEVVAAYIVDKDDLFVTDVKFLKAEYKAQRWLTGWKERLLAHAVDRGYEIDWDSGLKSKGAAQ